MNFTKLIKKNLKIIFRSKVSALVLVFGPLLVVIIAGLAFNNSLTYNIKIGVFSESYSDVADSLTSSLDEDYTVFKFNSKEDCLNSIKSRGYHACIVIPPDLTIDNDNDASIEFYFDSSRVNIAGAIKQSVYRSIGRTNNNLSKTYATSLLDSISYTKTQLDSNSEIVTDSISELDSSKQIVSKSSDLLNSNKVEFNVDSLNLGKLKSDALLLKTSHTKFKSLSSDAIDKLEDISPSNATSFKTRYSDLTSNTSIDPDVVITGITTISSTINTLGDNIEDSNEKVDVVNKNLDFINTKVVSVKENLKKVDSSFNSIEQNYNSLKITSAEKISSPVKIEDHSLVSGSKLNFLFPNLIILVIMFMTLISSAVHVINEKKNKASLRMKLVPNTFSVNFWSTFFTILILTMFQLILILIASYFIFDINVFSSFFRIILVLLLTSMFFTLLGISIGYIFNTEHSVMLASISVASFLFIVSDLILPIESMPEKIVNIVKFTPFMLGSDLLRKVMFFDLRLADIRLSFYVFVLLSVVLLLTILLVVGIHNLSVKISAKRRSKNLN